MTALHPDAAMLMQIIRETGRPPFEMMTPEDARAAYRAGHAVVQTRPAPVASVADASVAGPAGPISLRLYRARETNPDEILPCLVYLHGGGWVIGDLDSHDTLCRALANAAGCCVASVDYRLAPEHPFPAAVIDAAAAFAAVAARAAEWRIDPARIAVGGDSAGGNLAAVVALMARDGDLPKVVFQLLIYPATDLAMTGASYGQFTEGVPLTAPTMRWFVGHYTPDPAARTDWRASPLRAASLAGVAPALVLTVGHDPLCDEGRAYAERLEREGVPVTLLHLSDQPHGLVTLDAVLRPAALYINMIGATLRAALASNVC